MLHAQCAVRARQLLMQRDSFQKLKICVDPLSLVSSWLPQSPFPPPCVQGKHRMRHDFTGVVERMERLRAPLEYAWGVMSHLTGVKNSDPLRDAHQELQVSRTALCKFSPFGFWVVRTVVQ